jgi:membrane protease YdiL (CAAX protease family)/ribosomal protein L37E
MQTFYKQQYCRKCGKLYDPTHLVCPRCGEEYSDPKVRRSWQENTPTTPLKESAFFLGGLLGLNIIEIIVEFIVALVQTNYYRSLGFAGEQLKYLLSSYLSSGTALGLIFFPTYTILFAILLLIMWKDIKRVFARFANPKTYIGIFIGIGLIAVSMLYSMLISLIPGTTSNANQSNVEKVIAYSPALSIIVLGLIGPFCEEVTYRLGLFTFLKRWNIYAAYIVGALIFGCIHFDWTNITSLNEWLNFPDYVISGLILAFAYDKFGFGASFLAHATNNVVSVIEVVITQASK